MVDDDALVDSIGHLKGPVPDGSRGDCCYERVG